MPFNGSGVFSILNVFLPATTILSTPMNSNFTDIAAGLTDCLTRDGQAGMTAQLKAIAGTVGAPGITFTNDVTTGLYLSNTGELSFTAAGVRQAMLNSVSFIRTTAVVDNSILGAASISTSQNNYAPTGITSASTVVLTLGAAVNLTGLAGQDDGTAAVNGRRIILVNTASGFAATLVANSGSSIAANRFAFQSNVTLFSGQTMELIKLGNGWNITGTYQFVSSTPLGNCQLRIASATVVTLFPYQGNFVTFPSGAVATIPSAGISSTFNNASLNGTPAQTLSNLTLYYAYLWDSGGGTYVIDWSVTGHATDTTTGIEIKSGDATRVLIGMAYLVGANFLDSATNRNVASWFNRRRKQGLNSFTTNRSLPATTGTVTEINQEIRIAFLSWSDAYDVIFSGNISNNSSSGNIGNGIMQDTTATLIGFNTIGTPNNGLNLPGAAGGVNVPSEGFHFISIAGTGTPGTATWISGGQLYLNILN